MMSAGAAGCRMFFVFYEPIQIVITAVYAWS